MFRSISYTEFFCLCSFFNLICTNFRQCRTKCNNPFEVFFHIKKRCYHNVKAGTYIHYVVYRSLVKVTFCENIKCYKNNMFRNFVWYGSVLGSYNVSGFVILHFCSVKFSLFSVILTLFSCKFELFLIKSCHPK